MRKYRQIYNNKNTGKRYGEMQAKELIRYLTSSAKRGNGENFSFRVPSSSRKDYHDDYPYFSSLKMKVFSFSLLKVKVNIFMMVTVIIVDCCVMRKKYCGQFKGKVLQF